MSNENFEEVEVSDIESEVLDEETTIEEAKVATKVKEVDPKDAEVAAVDAVDDAGDVTDKSPENKPKAKTKAVALAAMYSKLQGMKKPELMAAYEKMMGEMEHGDDEEEMEESFDHSVELTQLVDDEATLSEEFKAKTAIIFETALKTKLKSEIDRLEENYKDELAEEVSGFKSELVEKVDSYLNYVVDTYMTENKLEVSNGLRTEIAEEFMTKLKQVFVESYIDVPDSKIDLVDDMAAQVSELEETVNGQIEQMMEMHNKISDFERNDIIREHSEGLAKSEIEKFNSLVENIEFESIESFSAKLQTVKESYFPQDKVIAEEVDTQVGVVVESTSTNMDQYIQKLRN
jgi:hypothetical protein